MRKFFSFFQAFFFPNRVIISFPIFKRYPLASFVVFENLIVFERSGMIFLVIVCPCDLIQLIQLMKHLLKIMERVQSIVIFLSA